MNKHIFDALESNKEDRRNFIRQIGGIAAGLTLTNSLLLGGEKEDTTENGETFLDIMNSRCSVRKYKNDPVPEEHIKKILNAAKQAPNAGNQQPWKFLVVRDRKLIDETKELC